MNHIRHAGHDGHAGHAGQGECGLCCLRTRGLTVKRDGVVILNDINLHAHCGEVTAIIGPNGAGKSTLFEALLGQNRYAGKVEYTDANTNTRRVPRFGYVPQTISLDRMAPVSVSDFMIASLSGRPVFLRARERDKRRVTDALAKVHAGELADLRLGTLSGGEFQRLMLALALEPKPDLLLLDEPVSGIDNAGKKAFYDVIASLRVTMDVSIFIITHDFAFVEKYADNALLLCRGEALAQGRVADVLSSDAFRRVFAEEA